MDDQTLVETVMTLDPTRSTIVLLCGMKGRGKSSAARMLFDAWPADRVVVDPTGNARPDDPATIGMAMPFPSQLPEPDVDADPPQTRVTVWARIDPGSPTFKFDQGQATNMALHPRSRRKLIWRDEFGIGTSAQTSTDADRTLLMSSRHYNITALLVVQRPVSIPPLAIQQSDLIGVWSLPNPDDRERVAKNAGIPVPVFERAYHDNQKRGRHAFLLFDREHDALLNLPPLPGIKDRGPKA